MQEYRDEEGDFPISDSIEPFYRLVLRILLYAVAMMSFIYIGCEAMVYLFHIQPSPDATIMLPALV